MLKECGTDGASVPQWNESDDSLPQCGTMMEHFDGTHIGFHCRKTSSHLLGIGTACLLDDFLTESHLSLLFLEHMGSCVSWGSIRLKSEQKWDIDQHLLNALWSSRVTKLSKCSYCFSLPTFSESQLESLF